MGTLEWSSGCWATQNLHTHQLCTACCGSRLPRFFGGFVGTPKSELLTYPHTHRSNHTRLIVGPPLHTTNIRVLIPLLFLIGCLHFDWCVVWWGSKKCSKEIGWRLQILLKNSPQSSVGRVERTCVLCIRLRNRPPYTSNKSYTTLIQGFRSNIRSKFCWCFSIGLLMQRTFCCVYLTSKSWIT